MMRKLLRVLGVILMVLSGLFVLSCLITGWLLITGTEGSRLLNAVTLLFMLAVCGGLFVLGHRLYKRNNADTARYRGRSARPEAVVPRPEAKTPALTLQEPGATLFNDPCANRSRESALESISVSFVQGVPCVTVSVGWNEGYHGGGAGECEPIPEALWPDLTPAALRNWVQTAFSDGYLKIIEWSVFERNPELEVWCRMVRNWYGLRLPPALLPAENPFKPLLENVGPDGLEDASGVRLWLRLKEGAEATDALRALAEWLKAHPAQGDARTCFLLVEDRRLAEPLPKDVIALCNRYDIRVAAVQRDRLRGLTGAKDYQLGTREWPGSADDAATYGEWWLSETHQQKG